MGQSGEFELSLALGVINNSTFAVAFICSLSFSLIRLETLEIKLTYEGFKRSAAVGAGNINR